MHVSELIGSDALIFLGILLELEVSCLDLFEVRVFHDGLGEILAIEDLDSFVVVHGDEGATDCVILAFHGQEFKDVFICLE